MSKMKKLLMLSSAIVFAAILVSFKSADAPKNKRIAIVVSNSVTSEITKMPVGFWWSELTHSYYEFVNAGYEVEIFSNDGGKVIGDAFSDPRDPSGLSKNDLISMGFIATESLMKLLDNTPKVRTIDVNKFDAIVVAGGQAPIYTFEKATDLQKKFVEFYEAKKVAAALCHGVGLLKFTKLTNGEYLAKGKTVTGFSNIEDDAVSKTLWQYKIIPEGTHYVPWSVEDAMKIIGAKYVQAGLWKPFAVRDGNLVTGQQNYSGAATARKVIEVLANKISR
jgi:putative intracellular protease/amidase